MENIWNGLPVVVFGTGATSKEAKEIIEKINETSNVPVFEFKGFVEKDLSSDEVLCVDEEFFAYALKFRLLGAVLPFSDAKLKFKLYEKFKNIANLVWPNIISPDANIINKNSVIMGIGNIIEAGAVININSTIGNFNIVNIKSIIGHDNLIADFCCVNPGAILSGNVKLENNVLIGAGAIVKQNITMSENSVLGLGAFTTKNIESGKTMICQQAKEKESGQTNVLENRSHYEQ